MMKNVSLFIVLIGFLFFSCKKWQRNESHNDFTVEKLIVDTKQTECLDTNQYIIPKILSLKGSEGMILPQYDKIVFYRYFRRLLAICFWLDREWELCFCVPYVG